MSHEKTLSRPLIQLQQKKTIDLFVGFIDISKFCLLLVPPLEVVTSKKYKATQYFFEKGDEMKQ